MRPTKACVRACPYACRGVLLQPPTLLTGQSLLLSAHRLSLPVRALEVCSNCVQSLVISAPPLYHTWPMSSFGPPTCCSLASAFPIRLSTEPS